MTRVLKCIVTPTLRYTAQVDENVLHTCVDSHYIIEYMHWTCMISTASDSHSKTLCYADFNIYRSSRRQFLNICFDTHFIIEYMRWTCFGSTASDSRFKMLCYAYFNIHRSSQRKCVTHLYWFSLHYWIYALNLLYMYR